ncbi:MAG: sulfotransferase family 2 domain-containing protein [Candidatus Poribacteria bacterium]
MLGSEFSIFLQPYSAVYIDIAKVASSSLKATFASVLGIDLDAAGGNPHAVSFPRPPPAEKGGARLYPSLYTFAFVRNPWDRLVSCYRDKIGGAVKEFTEFSDSGVAYCLERFEAFFANMSFEEFVDAVVAIPDEQADEHFRSQNPYLTNSKGETAVDFVGRYENLEADFRYVAERIGLPSTIELPRLQAARHSVNYVDYYTKETREIVAHRFREDIERFAYCFGS